MFHLIVRTIKDQVPHRRCMVNQDSAYFWLEGDNAIIVITYLNGDYKTVMVNHVKNHKDGLWSVTKDVSIPENEEQNASIQKAIDTMMEYLPKCPTQ